MLSASIFNARSRHASASALTPGRMSKASQKDGGKEWYQSEPFRKHRLLLIAGRASRATPNCEQQIIELVATMPCHVSN
jgi:hypothetical protein